MFSEKDQYIYIYLFIYYYYYYIPPSTSIFFILYLFFNKMHTNSDNKKNENI